MPTRGRYCQPITLAAVPKRDRRPERIRLAGARSSRSRTRRRTRAGDGGVLQTKDLTDIAIPSTSGLVAEHARAVATAFDLDEEAVPVGADPAQPLSPRARGSAWRFRLRRRRASRLSRKRPRPGFLSRPEFHSGLKF